MRWFVALLILAVVLPYGWQPGRAKSPECTVSSPVPVTATALRGEATFDFSRDVPELQRIANQSVHQVRQGWALGLTEYQPVMEINVPVVVSSSDDGLSCAHPAAVNITLGYRDMTVYLPSELSGDSCGFDKIMLHEDEHVLISQQVLEKYLPLFRARVESYLKTNGGVKERTPEAAAALQRAMINASLGALVEQMTEETMALQHDVDSPAEYQRLLDTCGGELKDLVKTTRDEQIMAQQF